MIHLITRIKAWRMLAQANHLRREADHAYRTGLSYAYTADAMLKQARMLETKRRIMLMGVL